MMFAAGLASMILFQLVVNLGMVIGIMPITGIPCRSSPTAAHR